MRASFPRVAAAMLDQRDDVMTQNLLRRCSGRTVAVVGMAHMDGIEERWRDAFEGRGTRVARRGRQVTGEGRGDSFSARKRKRNRRRSRRERSVAPIVNGHERFFPLFFPLDLGVLPPFLGRASPSCPLSSASAPPRRASSSAAPSPAFRLTLRIPDLGAARPRARQTSPAPRRRWRTARDRPPGMRTRRRDEDGVGERGRSR